MLLHLNDSVKVKLTPAGHKIHQKHWKKYFWSICPYEAPKQDENGWSNWTLWNLIEIFGGEENINIATPEPFATIGLEIEIAEQEQKKYQIAIILRQLSRKFGTLSEVIALQIESLELTRLNILTEDLLFFQTPDDLQVFLNNS